MFWENDKRDVYSYTVGQINLDGEAGMILYKTIKNNKDIRNVVDIGTWNGLGSTLCFIEAIKDTNIKLISLECNKEKNLISKKNLHSKLTDNINLIWGSILQLDDIKNFDNIFPELKLNFEYQYYHSVDLENIKTAPHVIDQIPDEIDFILFDGGEFTTIYEFEKLFNRCVKFIALDDTNVSKCKLIRNKLLSNPKWKEIFSTNSRNGFSVFECISSKE
jgi:hypothetical protein